MSPKGGQHEQTRGVASRDDREAKPTAWESTSVTGMVTTCCRAKGAQSARAWESRVVATEKQGPLRGNTLSHWNGDNMVSPEGRAACADSRCREWRQPRSKAHFEGKQLSQQNGNNPVSFEGRARCRLEGAHYARARSRIHCVGKLNQCNGDDTVSPEGRICADSRCRE